MLSISPMSRWLPTRTTSDTFASASPSATTSGPETFVIIPLICKPSLQNVYSHGLLDRRLQRGLAEPERALPAGDEDYRGTGNVLVPGDLVL